MKNMLIEVFEFSTAWLFIMFICFGRATVPIADFLLMYFDCHNGIITSLSQSDATKTMVTTKYLKKHSYDWFEGEKNTERSAI